MLIHMHMMSAVAILVASGIACIQRHLSSVALEFHACIFGQGTAPGINGRSACWEVLDDCASDDDPYMCMLAIPTSASVLSCRSSNSP